MSFEITLFDAHFHIIDEKFPLISNQGYLPEVFNVADYRQQTAASTWCGGAVVSGSFQGYDQTYLIAALKELGSGYVGVTQLPLSVSDEAIRSLHESGVRAVRFNLKRSCRMSIQDIDRLANRVNDLVGWHAEFYIDAVSLTQHEAALLQLPCCSIDHCGLEEAALPVVYRLVEQGVRVKATGFGRLDFDPMPVLQHIQAINPEALMFGTDLPSTRAPVPFHFTDVDRIKDCFSEDDLNSILFRNAWSFYGLDKMP
jgi:predicted TIM-barrel fold metal-dependent hydrolase